jgi:WSC domain
VDNLNGRAMNFQQPDNSALTIESCIMTCFQLGYKVAGLEYSVQCFCDNYLRNAALLANSSTDCNMACGGNAAEECGGPNRLNIYSDGKLSTPPTPSPQKTDLPGSWKYQGCLQ